MAIECMVKVHGLVGIEKKYERCISSAGTNHGSGWSIVRALYIKRRSESRI